MGQRKLRSAAVHLVLGTLGTAACSALAFARTFFVRHYVSPCSLALMRVPENSTAAYLRTAGADQYHVLVPLVRAGCAVPICVIICGFMERTAGHFRATQVRL